MRTKSLKSLVLFIFTYILFYYSLILFGYKDSRTVEVLRNLISTLGPFIATIWLFQSSFREKYPKDKGFKFLLGIGTLSYFIAEIIWMYYENYLLVEVPFPGWTDLFYMLQIVCYLCAIAYYIYNTRTTYQLFRWFFEVILFMVLVSTLSYHFFIKSLLLDPEITGLFLFVSIGYPVGDLVLLFSSVVLYLSSNNESKNGLFVILIGLTIQVFADTSYMYLTISQRYETGSLFDPLFTLSLLIVGSSSFFQINLKNQGIDSEVSNPINPRLRLMNLVIIYTVVTLLLLFLLEKQDFTVFSVGIGLSILLILVRQVFILIENNVLLHNYENKNRELKSSTQRYLSLFKFHPDGVFSLNSEGVFESANESCETITGMSEEELIGKSFYLFVDINNRIKVKYHLTRAIQSKKPEIFDITINIHNSTYFISLTFVPILIDGQVDGLFGIGRDITLLKSKEEKINYMAYHDLLTGLPNRTLFERILEKEISKSNRDNKTLGIMYLDVDRFKNINDTLGHDAGDELLISFAKRLQGCIKEQGIIARQGGDEFTLLFNNLVGIRDIVTIAEQMITELNHPYNIRGYEFLATPSIGISIYEPGSSDNAFTLMKKADLAMYDAKYNGKNQFKIFQPEMETKSRDTFILASELSKSIHNNELLLHYQPQVDVRTNQIYGVEALVRWNHPTLGLLYPGDFITVAEDSDLILSIGEWVLREACIHGKLWGVRVSINISPKQFQSTNLLEMVERVLLETGLEANDLNLEITETVAMNNMIYNQNKLKRLRELGVNVSIDDFGTGYSSLLYLSRLPITELKVPREFMIDLENHPANKAILQTIVTLGNHLNLTVIAEGVETIEQKELLLNMNCHLMQGYYFSKPLPEDKIERLLNEFNR